MQCHSKMWVNDTIIVKSPAHVKGISVRELPFQQSPSALTRPWIPESVSSKDIGEKTAATLRSTGKLYSRSLRQSMLVLEVHAGNDKEGGSTWGAEGSPGAFIQECFKVFYIPNMSTQFKSFKKRSSKLVVKVLQPSFCQPLVLLLCRADASANVRVKGCCAV